MKNKNSRLDSIKMIISSKEIGSQDELLQELTKEGFQLTQATLSRDLKQLKVAKAASMNGNYVYVLPNNTMYKRMTEPQKASVHRRAAHRAGRSFEQADTQTGRHYPAALFWREVLCRDRAGR